MYMYMYYTTSTCTCTYTIFDELIYMYKNKFQMTDCPSFKSSGCGLYKPQL